RRPGLHPVARLSEERGRPAPGRDRPTVDGALGPVDPAAMMSTIQTLVAGPFGQSALFPFVASLLVALVMRLAGGPGRGALLAGVGIPVGWLVSYALTFGLPPFLPPAALPKLAHVGLAAAVLGFLLDMRP